MVAFMFSDVKESNKKEKRRKKKGKVDKRDKEEKTGLSLVLSLFASDPFLQPRLLIAVTEKLLEKVSTG